MGGQLQVPAPLLLRRKCLSYRKLGLRQTCPEHGGQRSILLSLLEIECSYDNR
jgi:hypothetical protein